jgi:hypothetical protein
MKEKSIAEAIERSAIFNADENDALVKKFKAEVDAPFVNAYVSTLGGDEKATLMLTVAMEPKEEWPNKILQNSTYFQMSIYRNGTMDMFSGHMPVKFRKSQAKNIDDAIKRINDYIKKAKQ